MEIRTYKSATEWVAAIVDGKRVPATFFADTEAEAAAEARKYLAADRMKVLLEILLNELNEEWGPDERPSSLQSQIRAVIAELEAP